MEIPLYLHHTIKAKAGEAGMIIPASPAFAFNSFAVLELVSALEQIYTCVGEGGDGMQFFFKSFRDC
ncbi:hypothetical protein GCM10011405_25970 [Rufibacter glacialis]|nr:hypothetical protein GCM10011405_25970 [Rufibacter glacialis]